MQFLGVREVINWNFFSDPPIGWSGNGLTEGDLLEGKSAYGYPPLAHVWSLHSCRTHVILATFLLPESGSCIVTTSVYNYRYVFYLTFFLSGFEIPINITYADVGQRKIYFTDSKFAIPNYSPLFLLLSFLQLWRSRVLWLEASSTRPYCRSPPAPAEAVAGQSSRPRILQTGTSSASRNSSKSMEEGR